MEFYLWLWDSYEIYQVEYFFRQVDINSSGRCQVKGTQQNALKREVN